MVERWYQSASVKLLPSDRRENANYTLLKPIHTQTTTNQLRAQIAKQDAEQQRSDQQSDNDEVMAQKERP